MAAHLTFCALVLCRREEGVFSPEQSQTTEAAACCLGGTI